MNQHSHDFSLYLHCLSCYSWGIPTPERHYDSAPCGNCGALETVAYFPRCCLIAMLPRTKDTT